MCNVHNKRVFYLLGSVDNCNKNVKKLFPLQLGWLSECRRMKSAIMDAG
jgi:hypothetical protein